MGLFKRSQRGLLPSDIVPMMERFGRHEINVMESTDDVVSVFQDVVQPLFEIATNRTLEFIEALAEACVPVGGWAVYGAERTVVELVGTQPPGDDWLRILDGSIDFLRANFVPPIRIRPYEWSRWIERGGTANTWLPLRPAPDRDAVRLPPLADGETRPVIRLGSTPDANVVLVCRDGDQFVALIDARESDEDPTRTRWEWKRARDQYDLYVDIAWSSQVWEWAADEIEPFFPAPKALI